MGRAFSHGKLYNLSSTTNFAHTFGIFLVFLFLLTWVVGSGISNKFSSSPKKHHFRVRSEHHRPFLYLQLPFCETLAWSCLQQTLQAVVHVRIFIQPGAKSGVMAAAQQQKLSTPENNKAYTSCCRPTEMPARVTGIRLLGCFWTAQRFLALVFALGVLCTWVAWGIFSILHGLPPRDENRIWAILLVACIMGTLVVLPAAYLMWRDGGAATSASSNSASATQRRRVINSTALPQMDTLGMPATTRRHLAQSSASSVTSEIRPMLRASGSSGSVVSLQLGNVRSSSGGSPSGQGTPVWEPEKSQLLNIYAHPSARGKAAQRHGFTSVSAPPPGPLSVNRLPTDAEDDPTPTPTAASGVHAPTPPVRRGVYPSVDDSLACLT